MSSSALIAAVAWLATAGPAGRVPAADDPAAAVREAYRVARESIHNRRADSPEKAPHRDKLFTKRLAALWERDDRCSALTQEMGRVNWDPFLAAQDFDDDVLHDLRVEVTQRSGPQAEVRASFTNFHTTTEVYFDVVCEDSRWVIADIRANGVSIVSALLADPRNCPR